MRRFFRTIILFIFALNLIVPSFVIAHEGESVHNYLDAVGGTEVDISDLNDQIDSLSVEIAKQKREVESQKAETEQLQAALDAKAAEVENLEDQVGYLDYSIEQTKSQIQTLELEVELLKEEIFKTEQEIVLAQEKEKRQEDILGSLMRQLQKRSKRNTVEIMLSDQSISDALKEVRSLDSYEQSMKEILNEVKKTKQTLFEKDAELEAKKLSLEEKTQELANTQARQESDLQAKEVLLFETEEEKAEFEALVEQSKAIQAQIDASVTSLEAQYQQALFEKRKALNPDKNPTELVSPSGFIWPTAHRNISAYFHDPNYGFAYLFGPHDAIDIPMPSGTPLRSVADGIVTRVFVDGSSAFGYVMVTHGTVNGNSITTLYGHARKSFVQPGQYVAQGEIIAESGGGRGDNNAGVSTGPHLHLSFRANGIPVNPLNYLP